MYCPPGIGGQDAEGLGEQKAEAAVVAGIAKEHDGRLVQGVGGREDPVHQGLPDAAMLVGGQYAQRPQPNRGTAIDAGATAYDMSHDFVVDESDE